MTANGEVIVKPWWTSVSLWLAVLTAIGVVLDQLVLDGLIPNAGWYTIVAAVITLITKRGLTENTAIKANAIVTAAKNGGASGPPSSR